jgi:hypothetical protein
MPDNVIRIELKGATAALGEILAIDIARLIEDVERSIAAGAAGVLGHHVRVGRRVKAVELSTRLRLVGVELGDSVDLLLRVPEDIVSGSRVALSATGTARVAGERGQDSSLMSPRAGARQKARCR